ncbi:hypothetical protein WN48_06557 [Eufriesea mexicana]|uniref:Uncharacterized protein n=1 Tax=Eufriesea mexicana TaxID=516756 RepID=A0A310SK44_9HYME|nr:hypothetical protein WN48_06557 [Eufriesea mexicana]
MLWHAVLMNSNRGERCRPRSDAYFSRWSKLASYLPLIKVYTTMKRSFQLILMSPVYCSSQWIANYTLVHSVHSSAVPQISTYMEFTMMRIRASTRQHTGLPSNQQTQPRHQVRLRIHTSAPNHPALTPTNNANSMKIGQGPQRTTFPRKCNRAKRKVSRKCTIAEPLYNGERCLPSTETAISELIKRHSRGQPTPGVAARRRLAATSPEDAGHAGNGDKLRQHPCCLTRDCSFASERDTPRFCGCLDTLLPAIPFWMWRHVLRG